MILSVQFKSVLDFIEYVLEVRAALHGSKHEESTELGIVVRQIDQRVAAQLVDLNMVFFSLVPARGSFKLVGALNGEEDLEVTEPGLRAELDDQNLLLDSILCLKEAIEIALSFLNDY